MGYKFEDVPELSVLFENAQKAGIVLRQIEATRVQRYGDYVYTVHGCIASRFARYLVDNGVEPQDKEYWPVMSKSVANKIDAYIGSFYGHVNWEHIVYVEQHDTEGLLLCIGMF